MRVCFRFDEPAWELGPARHAVETVAALLEAPYRTTDRDDLGPEDVPVYVGRAAAAPADVACVIPVGGWEPWRPAEVNLASFEDAPLLVLRAEQAVPASALHLPPAWLRAIGFVVHRDEELLESHRDEWDCFSGFSSRLSELGVLQQPLVNTHALQLERRIASWAAARGRTIERVPRWKNGARSAVVLSHDVDWIRRFSVADAMRLLRQADGPGSYAFRHGAATLAKALVRGARADDPFWNFDRWVAAESGHGARSTFYVCPERLAARHPYDPTYRFSDPFRFEGRMMDLAAVLKELEARGFEVGVHGSYLSHRDAPELLRQRDQIAAVTGRPVAGIRQHFLRFDVRTTWEAQERAGFAYDATLGYNEALGFRAGIAAPFRPFDPAAGRARGLIEVPLTVMDGVLFRTLKLDAPLAARRVKEHLEVVARAGGLASLLWHPNAADEQTFPGWWACYQDVLGMLDGAWAATAREVAEWWKERETRQRR